MYSKIILTGGASVLSKNNYFGRILEKDAKIEESLKKVKEYAKNDIPDPTKVSVEYSLLYRLKENNSLSKNPKVTIVHTNTPKGELSAKINKIILEKKFGAEVTLKSFEFHINDKIKLNNEFGEYIDTLVTELKNGTIYDTFFSPTGGYKVMSYLGYVVGSFYGYNMGYLYEEGSILQSIPPMPIEFNISDIVDYINLIRKIKNDGQVSYEILQNNEKNFIDSHPYLFDKIENSVVLTAFGEFLLKGIIETKIFIDKTVQKLKNKGNEDIITKQLLELVKR